MLAKTSFVFFFLAKTNFELREIAKGRDDKENKPCMYYAFCKLAFLNW